MRDVFSEFDKRASGGGREDFSAARQAVAQ
jgi:hypothetical protein